MPSAHFAPLLETLTNVLGNVTFVQVGANDGVRNDPIEPFVRAGNWHGILIEPVPYLFARLQARYAGRADLIFENCAIADADGERTFYSVRELTEDEPGDAWGIGSFSLAHVLKHAGMIPNLGKRIQVLKVPCLTLRTLFTCHAVAQLDALITDAEGFDGAILQSIPFDLVQPALILFEHQHLKAEARAACRAHLVAHGYELLERHSNSLALSKTALAKYSKLANAWAGARAAATGTREPLA